MVTEHAVFICDGSLEVQGLTLDLCNLVMLTVKGRVMFCTVKKKDLWMMMQKVIHKIPMA
jgi:hypothetical protein